MKTRVITIQTADQVAAAAAQGAAALEEGKLVAFATETVYGLAGVATNPAAMDRLRELKSRPQRPFTVHIGASGDASRYIGDVCPRARRLMDKAWPGPLTLLLPAGDKLADVGLDQLLCWDGLIGLRCPDAPVAAAMLTAVACPVVAPSANQAGENSPRTGDDVLKHLDGQIDLLIDSGPTRFGRDSTIAQFDDDGQVHVVRPGVLDEKTLGDLSCMTVLFICTGNTCRSPMAAGFAARIMAQRLKCPVGELSERGFRAISAGVVAAAGLGATQEAVAAARGLGADIAEHRSQKVTTELIKAADLVFCMTEFHLDAARRLEPSSPEKVFLLRGDGEIPDPIGGGSDVYNRTAREIELALRRRLNGIIL